MKDVWMVISFGVPEKLVSINASISPSLKFWFCNVELDTQVFVDIDKSLDSKLLPFLVAFTSTDDPESV